jgi:hypothetical protein
MRTTTAVLSALVLSLLAPSARVAHACGPYGESFVQRSFAQRTVHALIEHVRTRNAAAALALLSADAERSAPYNGCCAPLRHAAAPWLSEHLARRTLRLVAIRSTTTAPDGATVTVVVDGREHGFATNITLTLGASPDGQWRVQRIHTARAALST